MPPKSRNTSQRKKRNYKKNTEDSLEEDDFVQDIDQQQSNGVEPLVTQSGSNSDETSQSESVSQMSDERSELPKVSKTDPISRSEILDFLEKCWNQRCNSVQFTLKWIQFSKKLSLQNVPLQLFEAFEEMFLIGSQQHQISSPASPSQLYHQYFYQCLSSQIIDPSQFCSFFISRAEYYLQQQAFPLFIYFLDLFHSCLAVMLHRVQKQINSEETNLKQWNRIKTISSLPTSTFTTLQQLPISISDVQFSFFVVHFLCYGFLFLLHNETIQTTPHQEEDFDTEIRKMNLQQQAYTVAQQMITILEQPTYCFFIYWSKLFHSNLWNRLSDLANIQFVRLLQQKQEPLYQTVLHRWSNFISFSQMERQKRVYGMSTSHTTVSHLLSYFVEDELYSSQLHLSNFECSALRLEQIRLYKQLDHETICLEFCRAALSSFFQFFQTLLFQSKQNRNDSTNSQLEKQHLLKKIFVFVKTPHLLKNFLNHVPSCQTIMQQTLLTLYEYFLPMANQNEEIVKMINTSFTFFIKTCLFLDLLPQDTLQQFSVYPLNIPSKEIQHQKQLQFNLLLEQQLKLDNLFAIELLFSDELLCHNYSLAMNYLDQYLFHNQLPTVILEQSLQQLIKLPHTLDILQLYGRLFDLITFCFEKVKQLLLYYQQQQQQQKVSIITLFSHCITLLFVMIERCELLQGPSYRKLLFCFETIFKPLQKESSIQPFFIWFSKLLEGKPCSIVQQQQLQQQDGKDWILARMGQEQFKEELLQYNPAQFLCYTIPAIVKDFVEEVKDANLSSQNKVVRISKFVEDMKKLSDLFGNMVEIGFIHELACYNMDHYLPDATLAYHLIFSLHQAFLEQQQAIAYCVIAHSLHNLCRRTKLFTTLLQDGKHVVNQKMMQHEAQLLRHVFHSDADLFLYAPRYESIVLRKEPITQEHFSFVFQTLISHLLPKANILPKLELTVLECFAVLKSYYSMVQRSQFISFVIAEVVKMIQKDKEAVETNSMVAEIASLLFISVGSFSVLATLVSEVMPNTMVKIKNETGGNVLSNITCLACMISLVHMQEKWISVEEQITVQENAVAKTCQFVKNLIGYLHNLEISGGSPQPVLFFVGNFLEMSVWNPTFLKAMIPNHQTIPKEMLLKQIKETVRLIYVQTLLKTSSGGMAQPQQIKEVRTYAPLIQLFDLKDDMERQTCLQTLFSIV